MQNNVPYRSPDPFDLPVKVASGVLACISTFFLFPFAFLSVGPVHSFVQAYYDWLPLGVVSFFWGVIVVVLLLSLSGITLLLGLKALLKLAGQVVGRFWM